MPRETKGFIVEFLQNTGVGVHADLERLWENKVKYLDVFYAIVRC